MEQTDPPRTGMPKAYTADCCHCLQLGDLIWAPEMG